MIAEFFETPAALIEKHIRKRNPLSDIAVRGVPFRIRAIGDSWNGIQFNLDDLLVKVDNVSIEAFGQYWGASGRHDGYSILGSLLGRFEKKRIPVVVVGTYYPLEDQRHLTVDMEKSFSFISTANMMYQAPDSFLLAMTQIEEFTNYLRA